jgi:hypothetical protein
MTSHIKFELLDHGYLELIEKWGSEEQIIVGINREG